MSAGVVVVVVADVVEVVAVVVVVVGVSVGAYSAIIVKVR